VTTASGEGWSTRTVEVTTTKVAYRLKHHRRRIHRHRRRKHRRHRSKTKG
jgi:hypothetical protein